VIISHRHRFVFIKTHKTAGTSVEIALSTLCGPDDVITPLAPEDEELRASCGGRPPQHYRARARLHELRPRHASDLARGRWPVRRRFWNHIPASAIRANVPQEVWNDYDRIAFVRNPWDYVVSRHAWEIARRGDAAPTLDEVVDTFDITENWRTITIRNQLAVDTVGRFESLTTDVAAILAKLGVADEIALPRAKASDAPHGSYRDVLSSRQADVIGRRCAAEIDAFGYEF